MTEIWRHLLSVIALEANWSTISTGIDFIFDIDL
jgi:hypothetical protein